MPSIPSFISSWTTLFANNDFIEFFEREILPNYTNGCRWFAGKARSQKGFSVQIAHRIPTQNGEAYLLIVEAHYHDSSETESYLLPLGFWPEVQTDSLTDLQRKGFMAEVIINNIPGLLMDAFYEEAFQQALYGCIVERSQLPQRTGTLVFLRGKGLDATDTKVSSRVLPVDSSNSAMVLGEKYFFKLYRKLFRETNPEVDLVSFLTEETTFTSLPAFAGSLTWQRDGLPDVTLGMMQKMVENQQDSWGQTGDYLNDFLFAFVDKVFAIRESVFQQVETLARCTAEMHLGLYAPKANEAFSPENFTPEYRVFLVGRINRLLDNRYALLIDKYTSLDPQAQRLAWVFMEARELIEEFTQDFLTRPLSSLRTRVHGDYHLGQVLATGNDYVIIDYEGEPESSISDRKIKHSPLKDVAGMIRSYHYAVSAKLFEAAETKHDDPERLIIASDRWYRLMKDTFLETYMNTVGSPHPLFKNNTEINYLMLVYLLEKAVYELGYELSYRPAWVKIPLKGIVEVIREIEKLKEA